MNKAVYFNTVFAQIIILTSILGCSSGGNDSASARFKSFVDPDSTLEWASFQYADNLYISYNDVISYCDTFDINGKNDWRMPNADETFDYLLHNTQIYEEGDNYRYFASSQPHDFVNILSPQPNTTYTSSNNPNNFVFKEIPVIKHYSDDNHYYGSVSVRNYNDSTPPDNTDISSTTETSALGIIEQWGGTYDPSYKGIHAFTCVRGTHSAERIPLGTWVNIENQIEVIGSGQYAYDVKIVDDKHIRLSTMMFDNETYELTLNQNAHYISSGIPDVRVKGLITSFAEASGAIPRTAEYASGVRAASVSGIAGIDVILGCIRSSEPEHCQEFIVTPATPDNPHNTYDQSAVEGLPDILYVYQDALGNYILDEDNPINIATGKVTISLTDSAGNTATFKVDVAGTDTDVGVLNIPDIRTLYNFKTTIDHGMDYIYHGYSDVETQIQYRKNLSICNVGAASISGTTFTIEVAPESSSLIRSFSHTYDGSSVGFTAGSCVNYDIDFDFYRPSEDKEVRFNITVSDNFNSLTWKDYTTFRLSQHTPVNVYFASNTQRLEGFLVTPGNQLVRVQFSEYEYNQSFVRVPSYRDNAYNVILFTSSIDGEDTYMITTVDPPDRTRMDSFSDVYAYEPNDDAYYATIIPLLYGEVVSYLHSGDLDFYTLKDAPAVTNKIGGTYTGEDIVIPFNTSIDPQSTLDSVTVIQNGISVAGNLTYEESRQAIVFDPLGDLNIGIINLTLDGGVTSSAGVSIGTDDNWQITIDTYPPAMSTINTLSFGGCCTGLLGLLDDYFLALKVTYPNPSYMAVYDDIDKKSLTLVGESELTSPFQESNGYCYAKELDANISANRIILYDCKDARNIHKLSVYPVSITGASVAGFTISGDRIYIRYDYSGKYGLDILDITDPLNPVILGSITSDTAGTSQIWGSSLAIKNNRLYVHWAYRLHIFDITNETAPLFIKELYSSPYFVQLATSTEENILYTTNSSGKLTVVDTSNPDALTYNESIAALPSGVKKLLASGTRLYTLNDQRYIHVMDISTPSTPTVLGSYRYSSSSTTSDDLMIKGNFAYIHDRTAYGLKIINIQMYQ